MPRRSLTRPSLFLLLLPVLLWSACASTGPSVVLEPESEPEPVAAGPALDVIAARDGRLVYHQLQTGKESVLSGAVGLRQARPDPHGNALATWTVGADSSRVHILDRRTGVARLLWDGPTDEHISLAWSPDGSWLFMGHHTGSRTRMGPGGIVRVDVTPANTSSPDSSITAGGVHDVGCSSSTVVLAARPDGSLVVRGTDNLYVVEADGCATLESIDARRMHSVTASPTGRHLAYIYRELVYNRDARAYEPDSTLYVATLDDQEPVKVIGDRYAPRNPVWSHDGTQLGYDVLPPDGDGRRTVSAWSVADGQSGYIIPPGAAAGSVTHLRFAPGSAVVAFKVDGEWHFRGGPGTFTQPFPGGESPTDFLWLDGNRVLAWYGDRAADGSAGAGAEAAILTLSEGATPEPYPGVIWAAPAAPPANP